MKSRALLFAALITSTAAATAADFQLNGGSVNFSAPSDWPVIMQMSEGNPQVVAFSVKDPAAAGTDETSRVTVTSKKVADGPAFQAMVNGALEKAKQQQDFNTDKDNADSSSLRYSATEGKTRYHYREHFYFKNGLGVQVRCARPMLEKTSKEWVGAFEKGCDEIAASLAK